MEKMNRYTEIANAGAPPEADQNFMHNESASSTSTEPPPSSAQYSIQNINSRRQGSGAMLKQFMNGANNMANRRSMGGLPPSGPSAPSLKSQLLANAANRKSLDNINGPPGYL